MFINIKQRTKFTFYTKFTLFSKIYKQFLKLFSQTHHIITPSEIQKQVFDRWKFF